MVLGVLTVFVSVSLLVVFGTAESGQIVNTALLSSIGKVFAKFFDMVGTGSGIAYIIELIVLMLVECITQTMLFYLAITIGSIIAKKHKILASAGVYLGINAIVGVFGNIGAAVVFDGYDYGMLNNLNTFQGKTHALLIMFIIFYLITGVVCFIITDQLLKKKLNLE
jgi:hypothetical protein